MGRGAGGDAVDAPKEQAHDYRYFPEPDLPRWSWTTPRSALGKTLPELPEDRFARYTGPVGLSPQDAGVLVTEREIAGYYDAGGGGGRAREARRELGDQRGAGAGRRRPPAGRRRPPRAAAGAGRAGDAGRGTAPCRASWPRMCSGRCGPSAGPPPTSSPPKGWPRSPTAASRADLPARHRRPPRGGGPLPHEPS